MFILIIAHNASIYASHFRVGSRNLTITGFSTSPTSLKVTTWVVLRSFMTSLFPANILPCVCSQLNRKRTRSCLTVSCHPKRESSRTRQHRRLGHLSKLKIIPVQEQNLAAHQPILTTPRIRNRHKKTWSAK